jgi:hypothetical protein
VIAQHYEWAQTYGVDVFFCSWHGPGGYDDVTIRDDLLPSPARGPTKVALLYESLQRLGIGPDARIQITPASVATMVGDFDYMARTYFGDPGYYRIDGRPVVIIYASRIFRGDVAGLIDAVREHLIDTYGIDPYLIGDEVNWDNPPDPARIALFDAITGYTPYSVTQQPGPAGQTGWLQLTAGRTDQFRRVAAEEGVGFVPGSLPGFDSRAVRPGSDEWVLPRAVDALSPPDSVFTATLQQAGGLVDPALRLMTVTSWNEWYEDSQIEPTADGPPLTSAPGALTQGYAFAPYGFTFLDDLKRFKADWEAETAGSRALVPATPFPAV